MKLRIATVLATWFGCGRVPFAPGTLGTLAALPVFFVLRELGAYGVLGGAIVITIVVIDEVAGLLVTLSPGAQGWSVLVGLVAFRIFDQWKPWPANVFEARLPDGWGIVMDDVAAGVWAALLMVTLRTSIGI
jgi:phosphatidylglycerophosphatase A